MLKVLGAVAQSLVPRETRRSGFVQPSPQPEIVYWKHRQCRFASDSSRELPYTESRFGGRGLKNQVTLSFKIHERTV
jgi:hypothetical protein